jgi:alpha-1,6-mannosyltransferase
MKFFDWSLKFMYQQNMDATFVASKCVQDELAQVGINNTILTPLGVDTRKFDPLRRDPGVRRSWGAGPGDKVLLHAGRMSVEKGTNVVLGAAERLLDDPRIHLVMAGRGGMTPQVEDLAAGHDRVHYMGYVADPERLGAIFASCDAYLGTGPFETFGLAILEALASGLAVVATDEGAGPELVENSGAGLTFNAGDSESLVQKVHELLSYDLRRLGAMARHFAVTNGTWTSTFDLMYRHYGRLLAARRGEDLSRFLEPRAATGLIRAVPSPSIAHAARREIGAVAP